MIEADDIARFGQAIRDAKTIFISAHVGPDGDTLGSMLGLRHALLPHFPHLETLDCVISGKMPDIYKFMPGINQVKDAETATDLLPVYDLAFSVDCGSLDRLGPAGDYFARARHSINIDHHISNNRFGKHNIIDVEAGASGEVVADLLTGNGITIPADAATCLYVAILTDTGGFKYTSTTAKIFDLAALLTRQGANPEQIYRFIYEKFPKAQGLLQAEAFRTAHFNADSTLSWAVVTQAMLNEFGANEEHVEGLVETLRRVSTVLVSAVLRETKLGQTKVSLRSDIPAINVADVVMRWNGGGHKMAAGCTIDAQPEAAQAELIPLLQAAIDAARSSVAV